MSMLASVMSRSSHGAEVADAQSRAGFVAFWLVTFSCATLYWVNTSVYLDDAYVYLRVAENAVRTGAPVFNAGDTFNITTSPLWMAVTTLLARVASAGALPLVVKVAFVATLVAAARMLAALARPHSRVVAALSAVPIFFSASMPTLAGMETGVCLFTGLGLIWSYLRRDRWTPVWMALVYLARPEGAVFAAAIGAVIAVSALTRRQVRPALTKYGPAIAIAAILVLAWHAWFFATFHSLTSATANVKTLQGDAGWVRFAAAWQNHLKLVYDPADPAWINMLRLPISIVGLILIVWRCWPLLLWPILHFTVFSALGVAYYHWYYYPVDLVVALSLVVGVSVGAQVLSNRLGGIRTVAALAVAVPIAFFVLPNARAAALAAVGATPRPAFGDARYATYLEFSKAMNSAAGQRQFTLLSHEIGIFGFLMPSANIRDVVGLATPVSSASEFWNWAKQVAAFNPDFLLWPFPGAPDTQIYRTGNGDYVRYRVFRRSGAFTLYRRDDGGPDAQEVWREVKELQGDVVSAGAPSEPIEIGDRVVVFAHAPAEVVLDRPPTAVGMRIAFGYRPDAYAPGNNPDGARFIITDASSGEVLLDRVVDPLGSPADRGPQDAVVATTARRVGLRIDPLGTTSYDWTYVSPPTWLDAAALRRGLAEQQARTSSEPAATPKDACPQPDRASIEVRGNLRGSLDGASPRPDGRTLLRGWAADPVRQAPATLVVAMQGGKVIGCGPTGFSRPDVARATNADALAASGFQFEVKEDARGAPVHLVARSGNGSFQAFTPQ